MIAKLRGLLDSTGQGSGQGAAGPGWAVIDVAGVGYHVFASGRTLGRLPPAGGTVSLIVETHVREDHIHLYGFADAGERDWFRLLCGVQGVGAKTALAVLTAVAPGELAQAVAAQDKAMLTRADGVGPKLAQRIVNELKDKVGGIALGQAALGSPAGAPATPEQGAGGDAVSALVHLGYGRSEAFGAVASAQRRLGDAASTEALIRAGLKELSQ
ncbi:MAG: Holliday junction branch migration protein RuvA [Alphaproteobacteria bacterium]|nr:Holliday junction branch migration protein RuvA [Alphaproteobacteria bacterium]